MSNFVWSVAGQRFAAVCCAMAVSAVRAAISMDSAGWGWDDHGGAGWLFAEASASCGAEARLWLAVSSFGDRAAVVGSRRRVSACEDLPLARPEKQRKPLRSQKTGVHTNDENVSVGNTDSLSQTGLNGQVHTNDENVSVGNLCSTASEDNTNSLGEWSFAASEQQGFLRVSE